MLLTGCFQYYTACLSPVPTVLRTPIGLTEAESGSSFAGGNVSPVDWTLPNATCVSIALRSGATHVSGISVVDDGRDNIFQVCTSGAEPAACPSESSRAVWVAGGEECTATFDMDVKEVEGTGCLSRTDGIECILKKGSMFFLEADGQQCCGPRGRSCNARCAPESWDWTCSDCFPEEPPTAAQEAVGYALGVIFTGMIVVVLVALFLFCTIPGQRFLVVVSGLGCLCCACAAARNGDNGQTRGGQTEQELPTLPAAPPN